MVYSAFNTSMYYPDGPLKAQEIPEDSSVTHYSDQGEDEDVQFQESQIPLDAAFLAEAHLERSLLDSPEGEYQVEPDMDMDRDGNNMHIDDHGAQCHGPPLCEAVLSPDMHACRDGFISKFKHDKMGMASSHDQDLIIEVRRFYCWADCKLDACLCRKKDPEGRQDNLVYEEIYGLQPSIVDETVNYEPTIRVLNQHATVISSCGIIATNVFYDAFWRFIDVLEDSDFASGYLEKGTSRLSVAYAKFQYALNYEVGTAEQMLE